MRIGSVFLNKINNPVSMFAQANPAYHTKPYSNDTFEKKGISKVSFLGDDTKTQDFEIKNIKNLHCPVCGLLMLDKDQVDQFVSEVAPKKGVELVRVLTKYEDEGVFTGVKSKASKSIYRPQKQQVVNIIKKLALEYPEKNLAELVQFEAQNHIDNLIRTQMEIIAELENYLKNVDLSYEEKLRINFVINEYKSQIKGEGDTQFQRKQFIKALSGLTQNQKVQFDILKIARQMPASDTEIDAFFVKYSKGNRGAREIASKFVYESLASAEHLIPKNDQGQDKLKNYICDCSECNAKRKDMSFYEWQKTIPNFAKNLQEYLYEVQRALERGDLSKDYATYIDNITAAISQLSDGEIILSRPDASNNRKKRALTKRQLEIRGKINDLKRLSLKRKNLRNEIDKITNDPNYSNVQKYVDAVSELKLLKANLEELEQSNAPASQIAPLKFSIENALKNVDLIKSLLNIPLDTDIAKVITADLDILSKIDIHKKAIKLNKNKIAPEKSLISKKNTLIYKNNTLKNQNDVLIRSYNINPDDIDDWLEYKHLNELLEAANAMLTKPVTIAASKYQSRKSTTPARQEAKRLRINLRTQEKEIITIAKRSILDLIATMENKETVEYARHLEEIEANCAYIKEIDEQLDEIQNKKVLIKDLNSEIEVLLASRTYEEIKEEYDYLVRLLDLIRNVSLLPKKREDMEKMGEIIETKKSVLKQLEINYSTLSSEEYDQMMELLQETFKED